MLVLTRKRNERIRIGPDIVVTVLRVDPLTGAVSLGIEAPNGVSVMREELLRDGRMPKGGLAS